MATNPLLHSSRSLVHCNATGMAAGSVAICVKSPRAVRNKVAAVWMPAPRGVGARVQTLPSERGDQGEETHDDEAAHRCTVRPGIRPDARLRIGTGAAARPSIALHHAIGRTRATVLLPENLKQDSRVPVGSPPVCDSTDRQEVPGHRSTR